MEHIETKNSSDSQLQVSYTCSIRIVSINRDIDQTLNPTKAKRREYEFYAGVLNGAVFDGISISRTNSCRTNKVDLWLRV